MATKNYGAFSGKSTVTFIDMSPDVKKTLEGLSKTALREAGKVIRKKLRESVPLRSKRFKNHIGSWAMINRQTGQPTLQIGFYSWQKVKSRGKQPSHASPHWIEFGTKSHLIKPKNAKMMAYNDVMYGQLVKHPGTAATHVLRNAVYDNIAEIRAAEEKYLAELSQEIEAAKAKMYQGEDVDESD